MKQLLTLLFIGLMSLYAQTVPSYVPTNGLVGWWPFNGNANDESGNLNNGAVFGATLTSDRNGNNAKAFSFNGTNQYIIIDSATFLTPQYSVSIWFKSNNGFCPTSGALLRSGGGSCDGKGFAISNSNNEMNFGFNEFINSNQGTFSYQSPTSCSSYNPNSWHNIVFTRNLNYSVEYFNGQPVDTSFNTSYQPSLYCPIYIGSNHLINGQSWNVFSGFVDDLAIWNRALSPQEVMSIFLSCSDTVQAQPQNFTAYSSTGWANFKCRSTDSASTYQWQQYVGSGWTNLSNFGNYIGATSDSLVITGVTSVMNNYGYRCIVTGCKTDTSNVAVLTVVNGIGVGESSLQKLTVSPNPTTGLVSLNTSLVGNYELLTLDGRVLETGAAKKDYDLTTYPKGVYHLRLSTDEGTRVLKVVKN